MWEADSTIDKLELGDESLKTQKLHAKYVVHLARVRLLLKKEQNKYNKMKNLRWGWYRGTLSREELAVTGWDQYRLATPLKSEMDAILESDEILVPISDKVEYLETMLELLQGIMKSINSRTWDIKNSLEWNKITQGLL